MGLDDIFSSIFGGGGGFGGFGGGPRGPARGNDLQMVVEIDFTSAAFGSSKEFTVDRRATCQTCQGSRMRPGTSMRTCSQCGGRGVVIQQVRTPLGVMQSQSACPGCQGQGQMIEEFCDTCGGQGRIRTQKKVAVTIPCGVSDGAKLRISGAGDDGEVGAPPGDLYLVLRVQSDPRFAREDTTISTVSEIPFTEAILGCTIDVDTIDGKPVSVSIPAGTQPNARLRLAGKGVPALGKQNQRGDHIITVKVSIPRQVNDEQRKLVEQLKASQLDGLAAVSHGSNAVEYIASCFLTVLFFAMVALIAARKFGKCNRAGGSSSEPFMQA
eukprot:gnl/TRDRNA2_/TRDRNA2_43956_c0_seq1.p1 gnl/TRDRNA2_/TRDRNA2_43956_c0~~gnl/TRDRNA2_/TRDRNA2_43956_c0_seq1.p1  ORF type:complete len:341 (-),score=41.38 gnl/TRDRNA2_/TRDRNA2_43956_c0_seq1:4-981(-)